MKLELLDAYNVRARMSASILLLAPIPITFFFLFEEVHTFGTSSIILLVLLTLTNYIPILQRTINSRRPSGINYAARLLEVNDNTLDTELKLRYYAKLSELDKSFECFKKPEDTPKFKCACESAVAYLRNKTRNNHLVQEENINFGFCKNLFAGKVAGIIISVLCAAFTGVFSMLKYRSFSEIPTQNYLAFATDGLMLLFWVFFVTNKALEQTGIAYAKTLISSIDTIN